MNLCEFPTRQKFKLLYRASEDGFSSSSFHEKCDGIKNTLTIIKSTNNNIFGGYTGAAWNQKGSYIYDTDSFIYSFINKSNFPFKTNCTDNENSIVGHSSLGPRFGIVDLYIYSDSDKNKTSSSSLGHSYNHVLIERLYVPTILAGSMYFQTTEIEVFEKLN